MEEKNNMSNFFIEIENIKIKESINNNINGQLLNESLKQNFRNKMETIYSSNSQTINMKDIQKILTPIIDKCDLFISYSYQDKATVEKVVRYYNNKGYNVFADCMFWEDVNAEITKYNDHFNVQANGTYNHTKAKKIAASFYAILMDSLYDMIRQTKKFLFIKSAHSFTDDMTLSPWIYLENKFANTLHKKSLNEGHRNFIEDAKPITYPLDLSSFTPLSNLDDIK